jgi:pimeloyl-ACP methyl ester carboxylesterase
MFNVFRVWADLRFADLTLDPSDRKPGCYAGDPRAASFGPFAIGGTSTLRSWLSMWSLETSQCRGAPHLQRITVPSLVIQSLADRGVFPSDAQAIHDALAAKDKSLEQLPGEHYFEDTGPDEVADLLAGWITART